METGFVPVGDERLQQILDAVLLDGDAVEAHYLEVKSDIDLASALGLAKVVKFVLGAANRPTVMAGVHFEGRAVMVLGAGVGVASGVLKGVEAHVLADRAARYLGPGGPTFELGRLSVSQTREVLFVVVDAPRTGQPVYVCHADFHPSERPEQRHSLANGAVYVRMASATRLAKAPELLAMVARAGEDAAAVMAPVDFRVDVEAAPVRLVGVEAVRDAWVFAEKARFLEGSARTLARYEEHGGARSRRSGVRTAEEAERMADEWQERFVGGWSGRVPLLVGVGSDGVVLRVSNEVPSYLRAVQVEVTFHGCRGVRWHNVELVPVTELFEPVVESGGVVSGWAEPKARRSQLEADEEIRAILAAQAVDEQMSKIVSWRQQGSDLVVALSLDEVRPQTPWRMAGREVVVVADGEADVVRVSWVMTAEGRSERSVGEMHVPVVGEDAAEVARRAWVRLQRRWGSLDGAEPVGWLRGPQATPDVDG